MTSKKFLYTLLALFLFFLLCFLSFLSKPLVKKGTTATVKVYRGQRLDALAENLTEQNLISHPIWFHWLVRLTGNKYKLRYGEYRIDYPMSLLKLLRNMKRGRGLVQHRLTIVEGWTFNNIRAALSQDKDLNHTLKTTSNEAIIQKLNPIFVHPEGLFYPDTYFFTWGNSDAALLKTAYQKMQTILQNDWNTRAPNLPYQDPYQALIAASLIERETSIPSEKPLVSSVIINRLNKKMRLQIDPTVEYGLQKTFFSGITKKDLTIYTPYNTYLNAGLPPTPICMPSQTSIYAALHPAQTNYFYYVATGNGGHYFSSSYIDHLKQVEEYKRSGRDSTHAIAVREANSNNEANSP